jgi:hypothetical protein
VSALGFLILLIIATAVLFAWLLVSVTRFALSDLRLPGLRPSPAPPVSPPPMDANAETPAIVAAPEPVPPETHLDPELEAELAVREHLYGRRGLRR